MGWLSSAWSAVTGLFSGSSSGKSTVETVADIVDNYKPGEVTQHKMQLEDLKAGDESQSSARSFQAQKMGTSWFDTLIDGLNRLPRPLFALWAFGELTGIIPVPPGLNTMHPIVLNIIWTIIGFYFGVRTISQDLPKIIEAWQALRKYGPKA